MPCNKEVVLEGDKVEVLVIDPGHLSHCVGIQSGLRQVFQQGTREGRDEVKVVVRVELFAQVLSEGKEGWKW